MSELIEYHPELRVSRVKNLQNKRFLTIGNIPTRCPNFTKRKENEGLPGPKLKDQSFRKPTKLKRKGQDQSFRKPAKLKKKGRLFVKGVPTEFTNDEFKQILDHNTIQHTKAERMKSRRDSRWIQMFQIELSDPGEPEATISNKITCPQTGITFKVEEFRAPISVWQCLPKFRTLGQKL